MKKNSWKFYYYEFIINFTMLMFIFLNVALYVKNGKSEYIIGIVLGLLYLIFLNILLLIIKKILLSRVIISNDRIISYYKKRISSYIYINEIKFVFINKNTIYFCKIFPDIYNARNLNKTLTSKETIYFEYDFKELYNILLSARVDTIYTKTAIFLNEKNVKIVKI